MAIVQGNFRTLLQPGLAAGWQSQFPGNFPGKVWMIDPNEELTWGHDLPDDGHTYVDKNSMRARCGDPYPHAWTKDLKAKITVYHRDGTKTYRARFRIYCERCSEFSEEYEMDFAHESTFGLLEPV